jgi:hypothetical protein
MRKPGQTSTELMVLYSTLLLVFIFLIVWVYDSIETHRKAQEAEQLNELAQNIKQEIALAARSSEGYSRNFYLEPYVGTKNYSINASEQSITLTAENSAVSFFIQNIEGALKKGDNTIRKENGKVYLN